MWHVSTQPKYVVSENRPSTTFFAKNQPFFDKNIIFTQGNIV